MSLANKLLCDILLKTRVNVCVIYTFGDAQNFTSGLVDPKTVIQLSPSAGH